MKKNYFKKSLSLIMTVLMLMSCWVFVAPTEAEAATIDVDYPMTITYNNTTELHNGGNIQVYYYKINTDGTLDTSTEEKYNFIGSLERTTGTHSTTDNIPGWPFKIEYKVVNYTWGTDKSALKTIQIGNRYVFNDSYTIKDDEVITFAYNGTAGSWSGSTAWFTPSWNVGSSLGGATLQVPAYGTRTSGALSATFTDSNYDVTWPQDNVTYSINGTGATLSSATNSTTVSVTNAALANFTNATGTANLILTATGAGKTSTSTITLNAPKKEVLYENLFSLSDWYYSDSSKYSDSNIKTDLTAGTITITNPTTDSSSEYVTNATTGTHPSGNYSFPVTAGKTYYFVCDTSNATSTEVFFMYKQSNGVGISYPSESFSGNGKQKVEFTAPEGATMAEIRFDNNTDGTTATFSNIAIVEKERADSIDLFNWTVRPIRNVYTYNTAIGTLDVPARNGYIFNKWLTDTDGDGVGDAAAPTGYITTNKVLYSDWTLKTLDIGYDNLFSLSDLAYSGSATLGGGATGNISFDLDAGTVTIESVSAGSNNEVYTSYNADGFTMDVEPETEYIFTANVDFADTSSQMYGQMFIFCYDANGAAVTGPTNLENGSVAASQHIGKYLSTEGTHSIKFKTPAGCYKLRVRMGSTAVGVISTYSNIGVYKLADYNDYASGYSKVREPFKYGDTDKLMIPSRDGYRFDGWFTADGTQLTSVEGLYESDTVYAHWTKLWTVTFLDGDKNTIKTVEVPDGGVLSSDQYPLDPDKKSDDNYSYTFESWDYDGSVITSDITVSPTFTSTDHTSFTYGTTAYKSPTCTQNATVAKYCADCGYDFGYVVFDGDLTAYPQYKALGHDFDGQQAVQGSDNGSGQHKVRCARYSACGAEKYVDHSWSFMNTTGATCVIKGTNHYQCACGATKDETGVVAPDVHDNTELINDKDPTCLEDGYTGDTYCNDCKQTIATGETLPALGHDWEDTKKFVKSDATCTDDAIYWQECSRCGISAEYDTTDTGTTWTDTDSKLGHTWENTKTFPKSAADCENDAVYYQECSACNISAENDTLGTGTTWTDENTAWGHKYTDTIRDNKDGTHSYLCANGCNTYGYDGVEDAATECTYGAWDTTDADNHVKTCEDCGYELVKAHEWSDWTSTDKDKAEAGEMTRYCTECGKVETGPCNYQVTADVKETCTTKAYKTYTCSDCGHGYTVIGNPATGHNYTGIYKYDAATDTHQQLCANGCGTYGVGTEEGKTEACTWTYANKEDGKHIASCVCGNSQEEACTGGQATCTAPATCEKCLKAYGSTAPHSFTGTPVVLEGDKHAYRCEYCNDDTIYGVGENQDYTEACSGGTATCSDKAECAVCGDTHGEINANNHKWSDPVNVDGTLTHKYTCQYDNTHTKTEDCVCSSPAVLAPDCETAGYQQNTCDECGHVWQTDPKDALGHDWSAWISNDDGTHTRTCERAGCGYNTENPGEAKKETASCTKDNATYVVTDPTCLDEGYTTYTCKDCGYEWVDDYTKATGHSYDKKTRKNTATYKRSDKDCTTALTYWYVCDNCDVSAGTEKDKYENEADLYWVAEEPANHNFDKKDTADEYLKAEATCTASAVYYYSCSVCGATSEGTTDEKTFESGSALGHAWTDTEKYLKSAADCINDAVYYKECSRCNISSEGETNATWTKVNTKTGHDFDHDDDGVIGNEGDAGYTAAVEPTCSDSGVLEHYTCSVCDKMYADEDATEQIFKVEVAAKGHDWKSVAYKAPTCEEDGHTSHKACSVCGTKNSDYQVREKTGHNFTGAYTYDPIYNYHSRYCVNENCLADGEKAYGIDNEKYSVEYDGLDYVIKGGEACDFDSFTTATDENGLHSHNLECVCGNAQSVVIDTANIKTEVVAPTCTDAGYTLHTCQKDDCGDTWKTDIVEKLGHDLKGTATSNGNGTHSVKCARNCGYSADAEKCSTQTPSTTCGEKNKCDICGGEFGEEIAHVFTNYVYNNDATCTADGTKTAECDNCDTNATNTITATGTKLTHDMSAHGYVVPDTLKAKLEADGVVIAEPTCGEEGRSISYCSRCDHYVTKVVPKNKDAHDMPEEWTKVGGNCASGVTYVRACTVCGKKESKTESVPHNWKAIVIEEAGCTVNGYINFECSVCGFTATLDDTVEGWPSFNGVDYTDKNIVATGKHAWQTEAPADEDYMMIDGVVVFVEEYPTYNTTGRGYKKCTICNAVEKVIIAAYGNAPEDHKHPELGINDNSTLKYVAEVKPTCNVGGHKGYYECTRCSYSQYNIDHDSFYIPALGHTAPNSKGKCDRCKTTLEEDSASKNCGCICHKDSGFMKFIYMILRFFWKLFGMNKTCACGVAHY